MKDQDVRKVYTDKIFHLTTVEEHPDKKNPHNHRPPVCRLILGLGQGFFSRGFTTIGTDVYAFY